MKRRHYVSLLRNLLILNPQPTSFAELINSLTNNPTQHNPTIITQPQHNHRTMQILNDLLTCAVFDTNTTIVLVRTM